MKSGESIGRSCVDSDIIQDISESMPDGDTLSQMSDAQINKYVEEIAKGAAKEVYSLIRRKITVRVVRGWLKDECGL
jgi:hypothetical protein